jgi:truncated hemoglobin YjbI
MSKPYPVSACFSGGFDHPVQRLQARAEELSGITYEQAHVIDDVNLGEKIGEFSMMTLSESFYKKCVNDPDEWFSDMFLGKEDFAGDQNEYMLQRLGGPSYYTDRKGHPNLIKRHAHVEITSRTAERWLDYMEESLGELENNDAIINHKQKTILMNHFRYQAYYLVAAHEAKEELSAGGPVPPNADELTAKCPYPTYSKLDGPLPYEVEEARKKAEADAEAAKEDGTVISAAKSIDFGLDDEEEDD